MVTLFSLLAVGFALGMRHAMDADHVLAVATIVTRERSLRAAAGIGVLWGVGHSLTVFAVGTAIVVFDLVIPERVGLAMEFAVGCMLVVLGVLALWNALRTTRLIRRPLALPAPGNLLPARRACDRSGGLRARVLAGVAGAHAGALLAPGMSARYRLLEPAGDAAHAHLHAHGDYLHTHAHRHDARGHGHGEHDTPQGRMDRWFGGLAPYQAVRPVVVGILHGLAGSAAVALLVLAAIDHPGWGMAYLAVFGLGTTLGMMMITLLIASPLAIGGRAPTAGLTLKLAAGALSLAFGLFLMYRIGFQQGLLDSILAAAR